MSQISFTKAVALGNDFVILDGRKKKLSLTPSQIQMLANRRLGIGCDQLICLLEPTDPQADVRLTFFNADGSQAEMCGNGTRSAARLLMEEQKRDTLCLQVEDMLCRSSWADKQRKEGISVVLGIPKFGWQDMPLAHPQALQEVVYKDRKPFCVSVGNPHAVFFVDNVDAVPLATIGPVIENHSAFPNRINVGFAQRVNDHTLRLRVWERGAGYTMACGTGACAAAVAAIHQKLVPVSKVPIQVIQEEGDILVDWREGHPITMTGPAHIKFRGEITI